MRISGWNRFHCLDLNPIIRIALYQTIRSSLVTSYKKNEKSKKTFLFNLAEDKEELHDRSVDKKDIVIELSRLLQEWEQTQFIKPRWPSGADVLVNVNGHMFYFPT